MGKVKTMTPNTLEVLVGRVRKKLGADAIETRRGFGYLMPGHPVNWHSLRLRLGRRRPRWRS